MKLNIYIVFFILFFSINPATASYNFIQDRDNTLILSFASMPTSLDPHYKNTSPNIALARHLYSSLFKYKTNGVLEGDLAEKYSAVDKLTWNIKIREDVYFPNGDQLTVDDVIYSFNRVLSEDANLEHKIYLKSIANYKKNDDYNLTIKTKYPNPDLINELVPFSIVKNNTQVDYSENKNVSILNGTGPYNLVKVLKGNDLLLKINNKYYKGNNNGWDYVVITSNTDEKQAINKLISKKVDVVEKINPTNIRYLDIKKYNFTSHPSKRLIFLYMDTKNEFSRYITNTLGEKIPNPLKHKLVRKALYMAINRNSICENILNGSGKPALQYTDSSSIEYKDDISLDYFNPIKSRNLLAQAGYKNGFHLKLHGPNGRYIEDKKILESVAKMFSEIGVITTIKTHSPSNYFKQISDPKYSMGLLGWANYTGKILNTLEPLMATYNKANKIGLYNIGRYSNIDVDKYINLTLGSYNEFNIKKYSNYAHSLLLDDVAIIPLHFEKSLWAMSKGIRMLPRYDSDTFALNFKKIATSEKSENERP